MGVGLAGSFLSSFMGGAGANIGQSTPDVQNAAITSKIGSNSNSGQFTVGKGNTATAYPDVAPASVPGSYTPLIIAGLGAVALIAVALILKK